MKRKSDRHLKGFTLIELLVVVAIIGILSTVVLGSLNNSRGRASNGSIKSSLANARVQAELFYHTNTSGLGYLGVCDSANSPGGEESIRKFINSANSQSSATQTPGYTNAVPQDITISVCRSSASAWAISVPFKIPEISGGTTYYYYCVDSTGTSASKINPIASSATVCPAS
jgi:prepilin-type N-terminal cleavage/methylation domain-containing protein